MAFKAKKERFGLGSISGLKLVSESENKSASSVEAKGEDGFTIAREIFGERTAPTGEYEVIGDVTLTGIKLGTVTEADSKKVALLSIRVTTSAGGAPKVSVSGQSIGSASTTGACKVSLPAVVIKALHHAQNFGQFSISGTGAHLTDSSIEFTASLSEATKDGETIAYDIVDGRIQISGTIQVSDAAYGAPTVTASGYDFTSPLTESNPDSNFPTYSFTAVKSLAADVAAA